eukprot:scaffold14313_cov200-Alexandrium_tamarense.AAC.10
MSSEVKEDDPTPSSRATTPQRTAAPPQPQRPLKVVFDDFSLPGGSSSEVRFRTPNGYNGTSSHREFRIYEQPNNTQLILEEVDDGDDDGDAAPQDRGKRSGITIKQTDDKSYGLVFLRATYSLIAVFVGGFLFILGFDILLFLFIDLATNLGLTDHGGKDDVSFIAVLLSIPVFVYSLSWGMTLVTRFVIDTFNGHPFLRTLFGIDMVATDWIAFVFYLGTPLIAFIVTLLTKMEDWWELSLLTWFSSVLVFWGAFSGCVLWYEIRECLDLIVDLDTELDENAHWMVKTKHAIVFIQASRLAGTKATFHKDQIDKDDNDDEDEEKALNYFQEGPWSILSKHMPCIFTEVVPPKRIYTVDEARGNLSFVTRSSWSLEALFCRRGGILSALPVTFGPSAITERQINSNIACKIIGCQLYFLLFFGVIVWFGLAKGALGLVVAMLLLFFIFMGVTTCRLLDVRKDILNEREVLRYWRWYETTRPTAMFTIAFICLEVFFLFFLPLVYLGIIRNLPSALLFAIMGSCASLRHYLNPSVLLRETQNHFCHRHDSDSSDWKKRSRFYHISGLGSDSARMYWTVVYLCCVGFFGLVLSVAVTDSKEDVTDADYGYYRNMMTMMSDYEYKPQPHLSYPTCQLKKGFGTDAFEDAALSNFAFFSSLAYAVEDEVDAYLNQWFGYGENGEIVATNRYDTVVEFQDTLIGYDFNNSAVSYRWIQFSDSFGVLCIRGTSTGELRRYLFQAGRFYFSFNHLPSFHRSL